MPSKNINPNDESSFTYFIFWDTVLVEIENLLLFIIIVLFVKVQNFKRLVQKPFFMKWIMILNQGKFLDDYLTFLKFISIGFHQLNQVIDVKLSFITLSNERYKSTVHATFLFQLHLCTSTHNLIVSLEVI